MATGKQVSAVLHATRIRLDQVGEEALADHELLVLLLATVSRLSTLRLQQLLDRVGGLGGLARHPPATWTRDLGSALASRLRAALEIGRRATIPAPAPGTPITCASQVAEWFRCRLKDSERECIHALLLDGKHRPMHTLRLSEGSWTCCPVDPKVVFAACLRQGAPAVILVHNHPSGDPTPSREDLELTERLVRAGQVVGVRVLDHLIVGRDGFASLADAGLI